jgi:hypothetical protein
MPNPDFDSDSGSVACPGSLEILGPLIGLLETLYAQTDDFLDRPAEAQPWYDRGYANGLASALEELGYGPALHDAWTGEMDPPDVAAQHVHLPWGRAYAHGFEMGRREAIEVLERL